MKKYLKDPDYQLFFILIAAIISALLIWADYIVTGIYGTRFQWMICFVFMAYVCLLHVIQDDDISPGAGAV